MVQHYKAWHAHCKDTCDELEKLRVNESLFKIVDATKVAALVEDMIDMSKTVPFNNTLLDMTKDVPMFLKGCQAFCKPNNKLSDFL
jgi:hypothetical protein